MQSTMSQTKRLCFWSATELLQAYQDKSLSPVDVCKDVLVRIKEVNDSVCAMNFVEDETIVIRKAKESEERYKNGTQNGLLDGVPVTIKDILFVPGWPTYFGSNLEPAPIGTYASPCVARLLEHNAILVGKTTTPDHGWCGVTISPRTGITRNPYDRSLTSGGSSGGAGAAVPLGFGPISIGTDAGGSVRIPSTFCNLSTIKPTFACIAHSPPSAFGTLSHVGPMTRTIEDTALCMDVIGRPDPLDWYSLYPAHKENRQDRPYSIKLNDGVKGLRVAVSTNMGGYVQYVHPEVLSAFKQAVQVLEELGAIITNVDDDFPLAKFDIYKTFKSLWLTGAAHLVHRKVLTLEKSEQELEPFVDKGLFSIAQQGKKLTGVDIMAAEFMRAQMGSEMDLFHEKYDVLVTPTLPIPPFGAELEVPENIAQVCTGRKSALWDDVDLKRWWTWTPFTYPFNLTKQPSASVPCGEFSSGGSIGLQVVGGMFQEPLVLRVCQAYQSKTNFHEKQATH